MASGYRSNATLHFCDKVTGKSMHLDFAAPSRRRRRRRGLRLALIIGALGVGAGAINVSLTSGARSASNADAASPTQQLTASERQSISLGVPDPTSSSMAMQSAQLPEQQISKPSMDSGTQSGPVDRQVIAPEQGLLEPATQKDATDPKTDSQPTRKPEGDEPSAEPTPTNKTAAAPATRTDDAKAATPADDGEPEWQRLTVQNGDSLARLFRQAGLAASDVHAVLNAHERAKALRQLHPGDVIAVKVSEDGKLLGVRHELGDGETLELTRAENGYKTSIQTVELERRVQHSSAIIRSSLFDAGSRVGLEDEVLLDIASIFRWDIDFALDIRRGDAFTVIYEAFYRDGEKVRNGDILAAEFVNRGETFRAVRYSNDAQEADYYDPDGRAMRKAFLRSPVNFTRVSSGFSRNRLHPTLGERRAHLGTDYAARTGTPIKATGEGRVVHRGWKGGYGRTIVLKHAGRYTTLYAHLSGYRGGLSRGDYVSQGQVIGYVGSSGRSTGPHLHYEFRVNGQHRDPQRVDLPSARPIPDSLRADFQEQTNQLLARLNVYSRIRLAVHGQLAP